MTLFPSTLFRPPFAAALAASLLLVSCAGPKILPAQTPSLALPRQAHVVEFVNGKAAQDAVLVVQHEEGDASRWSMFDPFGLPMARQMLQHGQWRNDGFLPPNAKASTLFSALIFAWTPEAELSRAYTSGSWNKALMPDGTQQRQLLARGATHLTITWQAGAPADTFSIHTADGLLWRVSPLKGAP